MDDDVPTCYLVQKTIFKHSFRFVLTAVTIAMMANTSKGHAVEMQIWTDSLADSRYVINSVRVWQCLNLFLFLVF